LNNRAESNSPNQGAALLTEGYGQMHVSNSCFFGNVAGEGGTAVETGNTAIIATGNWWGRYDGPIRSVADGPGEIASTRVTTDSWLTAPPAACANMIYPPAGLDQNLTTLYRTAKPIVLAAQGGISPYTFDLVSYPTNGVLSGTLPNLIYTPNAGFAGTDTFVFRATNLTGQSATGTISIRIVSDLVATNQNITRRYASEIPVTLDSTGGAPPLTYNVLTNPAHGTLSGTPPNLVYTPNPLYLGNDSFTFLVTDEGGFASTGTINLTTTWDLAPANIVVVTVIDDPTEVPLGATGGEPPTICNLKRAVSNRSRATRWHG
jgi:hypothetical protein